jgi:Zn-dependent membrane protease YugP
MTDLILLLLILIIPAVAQGRITRNYAKYKLIKSDKSLTGQEVARKILDHHGLKNVYVTESTSGELSDHYDPRRKVVRLSSHIFHENSIASVSVAAHECGHAIQDKEGYLYLKIRNLIFPIVNIATILSYVIIFIGIILQALDLVIFGIALTLFGLFFQIVTLPVEFDASKRANQNLKDLGIIYESEETHVKNMLNAAAFTYVAGVLASVLQILRLILITRGDK